MAQAIAQETAMWNKIKGKGKLVISFSRKDTVIPIIEEGDDENFNFGLYSFMGVAVVPEVPKIATIYKKFKKLL